ncbi:MAG: TIM barrel protein [Actinobacteria bacterium]|nr:TIM barrel protein [Actinomycetota bacterium]
MSDTGEFAVGLCSVTFRQLDPATVVDCAAAAGIESLEWGGDVHVPEGDVRAARVAATLSADAGLNVASYGSYLFLDEHLERRLGAVLDTTCALGAPALRVWAPPVGDARSDHEWAPLVDAARRTVDAAAGVGVSVYVEFHGGTATAVATDVVRLLADVEGLFTGWQVPYWSPQSRSAELTDLASFGDRLLHVDVYVWTDDGERLELGTAEEAWSERLRAAAGVTGVARSAGLVPAALLEFIPDDDPSALEAEVAALRRSLDR